MPDDALAAAKAKARATYDAAADHFDDAPLAFWEKYGRRTVEALAVRPGHAVLDVCCGTGASALPAAQAAGPSGSVIGVDLAERLLERARVKAAALGVRNVDFRVGDMTDLGFPDGTFDAVVIVFGIFFVPDMEKQVRELLRMTKPGGRVAVTTWGPRAWEPMHAVWRASLAEACPELANTFNPWDRITTPDAVRKLLADGGGTDIEVVDEDGRQPIAAPEDWWTIALGSGLRWAIDRMTEEARRRVFERNVRFARENAVDAIETNVIYGIARRPG
ncbi:MAG TPA: class I SAM-dependent methyltransferase [Polyangiaceae bacterium]